MGKLDAIVSTARGFMKFPTLRGITTVYRDKLGEVLDTKRCRQGPTGAIGPERWVLSTRHPEQTVTIGDSLSPEVKNNLKQLLRRNADIFAFEHSDMTGIPRDKAEHKLATLPGIKPVAQGKRSMAPDRKTAVVKEVRKLVEAGILRETKYDTWVSNPVMVKKPDGTWRMCIDFKDLNKAFPKDAYPQPEMNFKVDSLVPYRYKCFLDAYKGYHQIKMSREDEEKRHSTPMWAFSAILKCLLAFETPGEEKQMLEDIEETFQKLKEYNIKLNPKKCSFGVEEGKFLGVVVTRDGFKANPEKVAAITRMPSPRTLKEAQALNGRLVAINRFLEIILGTTIAVCVPAEATYLIQEIHAGICGIHAGPQAVVAKIHNAGYYWHGMHEDAVDELRKCRSCQKFAPQTFRPKNNLILVTAAWPFQKWAVDIVGPFPLAPGKLKYLIVAINYFTKWVEAKPLDKITAENAKKFLRERIVCRFGLPLYLVSDNGTQFTDRVLQDWCAELQIQQIFISVAHPQGNGQVEKENRSLLDGIKRRLGYEGSSWVEELPNVLWAHRTMPKTSNNETPFSLTYGTEAMIPTEVGLPSLRRLITDNDNERLLREGLDLLEERREATTINEATYKKTLEKYYNQRVAQHTFKEGEYVMHDNEASRAEPSGKLGPNWEGHYIIQEDLGKGAYRLSRLDGTTVSRSWNAAQLKKCYM
ncbi:uncharacterized protein LOC110913648 [Helianthus annuus]|uniref:uncharacterized protein LOC110913648 n=1 Tax=Helianthus annuus TaxID=4232 RepID=UPI000B9051D9|nr:uncharacterized protein LOC110913648 [Helianthus annuus]